MKFSESDAAVICTCSTKKKKVAHGLAACLTFSLECIRGHI